MTKINFSTKKTRTLASIILAVLIVSVCSSFLLKRSITPASQERERVVEKLRRLVESTNGKPSEAQLLAYEQKYVGTKRAALARFLRAYLSYTNGNYADSAALFDESIVRQGSELGDYALFYQGKAYNEAGNFTNARKAYRQLADKYRDSILIRDAQLAAADIALNKVEDPQTAIKDLQSLAEARDGAALLLIAQSYEKLGNLDLAANTYHKLYYEAPQSSESDIAEKRLREMNYKLPELSEAGYDGWLSRAEHLYEAGQYVRAADAYTTLKTTFTNEPLTDISNLRWGISLYKTNRFREATTPLISATTDKKLALEARYYLASSYLKQKLMGQFLEVAPQVVAQNPPADRAVELLVGLINYYSSSNISLADKYKEQLFKNYPQSKEADQLSYKAAWKIHQEKNFSEACDALVTHLANFPDTDSRGPSIFWAAVDAERTGQTARALTLYEALLKRYKYNYYGYLTEQRLSQLQRQHPDVKPEQAKTNSILARAIANIKPATPLPETATEQATPRLKRADDLHEIGLDELALTELEIARKPAPTSGKINLAIAAIYRDRNETLRAVTTLQRAHPDYSIYQGDVVPREVYEIFFPLKEWPTIKAEATRYKLDPFVVAGLIRQESVFDARALSRANARGFMQLLPSTAQLVARKQSAGNITADQLFNPQLNIKLGTAYFAELFNKYGRVEYAAAAYNGGPGRVDKWLNTLPSNIEDWVEAIPITETRLYVFGVVRNAAQYRRLYGEESKQGS